MVAVEFERELEAALREKDVAQLSSLLANVGPKDAAELMARMGRQQRALLYRTLPRDVAARTFDALDPAVQADLVKALPEIGEVFEGMEPDDRAELLDELPASVASRLVAELSEGERELTGIVLGYPEDSIGRRMSPELITLRPSMAVGEGAGGGQRAPRRRRVDLHAARGGGRSPHCGCGEFARLAAGVGKHAAR